MGKGTIYFILASTLLLFYSNCGGEFQLSSLSGAVQPLSCVNSKPSGISLSESKEGQSVSQKTSRLSNLRKPNCSEVDFKIPDGVPTALTA